jgi:hypothetical protein
MGEKDRKMIRETYRGNKKKRPDFPGFRASRRDDLDVELG